MKLRIKVDSEVRTKLFFLLFPLFKSPLFKGCIFELVGGGEKMKDIELALNIKERKKRIMFVYDKACQTVDDLFRNVDNTCGFACSQCFSQRATNSKRKNGCCNLCRFQSEKGCPTKNLACKLFFCEEVKSRYKVISFDEIIILKILSWRQRLLLKSDYFSTREEVLGDLYIGSLTIGTARLLVRVVPMIIKNI